MNPLEYAITICFRQISKFLQILSLGPDFRALSAQPACQVCPGPGPQASEAGIWFNTLRQSERCTKRGRSLKALCPASLNLMQVQLGGTSADDGF